MGARGRPRGGAGDQLEALFVELGEQDHRGDDLGAFRIGSTVVLLWPKGAVELDRGISVGGRVLVGQTDHPPPVVSLSKTEV